MRDTSNSTNNSHLWAQIENRAYDLWLADGRRDGNDLANWLQAERELLSHQHRASTD